MEHWSEWPMERLLTPGGFVCPDCGQVHQTQLRIVQSGAGAVRTLPEVLATLGCRHPLVVYDQNTYQAAGETVCAILNDSAIPYRAHLLPYALVEPDEASVGSVTLALANDPAVDILIAVGSGVINDICRIVAYAAGKKQMVVGCAPSMDGYASGSSSMLINGIKTTVYAACPVAIIVDTDILCKAPMRMLWAGLGDMLAKYTSVCEWRIAHIVVDEPYCEECAKLVRRSVRRIVENADKLASRDPAVIQAVVEGLILSGMAMSFVGTSRPASGLEHYFSHMWEMMALERGEKSDLHGIQVGVGTLLTLRLCDWVKTVTPDEEMALDTVAHFDQARWEAEVRRIFRSNADSILAIESRTHKNDPDKHRARLKRTVAHWDDIRAILAEELPKTADIASMLARLGMPSVPADLGIDDNIVRDAYIGSREIRDKFLLCSMLWDLGLTEEAARRVIEK